MLEGNFRIERLSEQNRENFYAVHARGEYGEWCNCVAWWVDSWDGWNERTQEQNRELREQLFSRQVYDGYILYSNDEAIGWCQVVQRDLLSNLVKFLSLAPDPRVWAISCFMLIPELRGKGLAHEFLQLVLEDLKIRGVARVQAYPRSGDELTCDDIWTGPEGIYQKAGFKCIIERPRRSVWEISL